MPDDGQYCRGETSFLRAAHGSEACEIAVEAGIPPGVLNIVTGPGSSVGEALVKHPLRCQDQFHGRFGNRETHTRPRQRCGKPVACELGGKNAFIVLPDADMKAAIEGAIWGGFFQFRPELRRFEPVSCPRIRLR